MPQIANQLFLLLQTSKNKQNFAARDVGITPSQHQLLLTIQGYPGRSYATPTELAERLQLKHHSCLGLIQRCEQVQLVQRVENQTDKRSFYVEVTSFGREVLEKLSELHQAELRRLGLTHRNLDNFVDGL